MTRHDARINVFTLIFESFFRKDESALALYQCEADERGFAGNVYIKSTFFGVSDHAGELDGIISKSAMNWKVTRMSYTGKSNIASCCV